MNKLTKKQRHEIYKKLLYNLTNFSSYDSKPFYICFKINDILGTSFYGLGQTEDVLPEIYLFNDECGGISHDKEKIQAKKDNELRYIVLSLCIEMTKP